GPLHGDRRPLLGRGRPPRGGGDHQAGGQRRRQPGRGPPGPGPAPGRAPGGGPGGHLGGPVRLSKAAIRQPSPVASSWRTERRWTWPLPLAVSAVASKASRTVAAWGRWAPYRTTAPALARPGRTALTSAAAAPRDRASSCLRAEARTGVSNSPSRPFQSPWPPAAST